MDEGKCVKKTDPNMGEGNWKPSSLTLLAKKLKILVTVLVLVVISICLCGYVALSLEITALQSQTQQLSSSLDTFKSRDAPPGCNTLGEFCTIQSRSSVFWYQCSTNYVKLDLVSA